MLDCLWEKKLTIIWVPWWTPFIIRYWVKNLPSWSFSLLKPNNIFCNSNSISVWQPSWLSCPSWGFSMLNTHSSFQYGFQFLPNSGNWPTETLRSLRGQNQCDTHRSVTSTEKRGIITYFLLESNKSTVTSDTVILSDAFYLTKG